LRSPQFYRKDFINYLETSNRSPRTIESYDFDLNAFLKFCQFYGIQRLEKVKSEDLTKYQNYLSKGGTLSKKNWFYRTREVEIFKGPLAVSSRRRHFSTLKNFFAYLLEKYPKKKYLPFSGFKFNPVLSKIHAIRLKDADINHTPLLKERDWLRLEELSIKPKDFLFLSLMYWAGLRLSEVKDLRKSQLDFETKSLDIIRKGGKRQKLYFLDKDNIILNLWEKVAFNTKNEFLFTWGLRKKPLTRRAAFRKVKKLFQKAGLAQNLSPHSLRKACATRLYQQTKDLLFVRDYLGHSDAKVTQTYIESRPDELIALDVKNEKSRIGMTPLTELQ